MSLKFARLLVPTAVLAVLASPLLAQDGHRAAIEGFAGWAGFVDNATIHHWLAGAGGRYYLTPRLGVGPEFAIMSGPGSDRDLMLTGNLTVDLLAPTVAGTPSVTPFFVAGGGLFQHRQRFGSVNFSSTEGSFTGGAGLRFRLGDRVYAVPEVRFGWELHTRISLAIGFRLGP